VRRIAWERRRPRRGVDLGEELFAPSRRLLGCLVRDIATAFFDNDAVAVAVIVTLALTHAVVKLKLMSRVRADAGGDDGETRRPGARGDDVLILETRAVVAKSVRKVDAKRTLTNSFGLDEDKVEPR